MKLNDLVPAGTPPNSNAGEIDLQAGMPAHEKRTDKPGRSSDVVSDKLK